MVGQLDEIVVVDVLGGGMGFCFGRTGFGFNAGFGINLGFSPFIGGGDFALSWN